MRDFQAQAQKARAGEDDRVQLARIEAPQARIHIAAQRFDAQVRPRGQYLRLTSETRGTEARTARQFLKAGNETQRRIAVVVFPAQWDFRRGGGHQRIAGVGARQHGGNHQPVGELAGHILHGMHGEIRESVLEGRLQFFDEQALAADRSEAPILDAVAFGGHRHELRPQGPGAPGAAATLRAPPARAPVGSCGSRSATAGSRSPRSRRIRSRFVKEG